MIFLKPTVTFPRVTPSQRNTLHLLLWKKLEEEYKGTIVQNRTLLTIDDIRDRSAFTCTTHQGKGIVFLYRQMMTKEVQSSFTNAIRDGEDSEKVITALNLEPRQQDFLMHAFGCGKYSRACVLCQTFIEQHRAIQLVREEPGRYSYFAFDSRIELPAAV